jgi:hypothetical protein
MVGLRVSLLYDDCMEAGSGSVLLKYMLSLASDAGAVWFGGWFACDYILCLIRFSSIA